VVEKKSYLCISLMYILFCYYVLMEFEGIIKVIWKEEEVWQNKLRKLTFVLEENSDKEYKSSMAIDLFNDKSELIKPYKVGDVVKVGLNFRAREYNGRWFNSISAWRIDAASWSESGGGAAAPAASGDDDLPF